jgi:hypothetical protein
VFRLAPLGRRTVDLAAGVDEPTGGSRLVGAGCRSIGTRLVISLEGVQEVAASIALVAAGALVMADGAFALDKSISQEGVVGLDGAVGTPGFALFYVAILEELGENLLDNVGLVIRRRAVEDVKVEAEPVVDGLVQGVVLGAQSGRVDALL